MSDPASQPGPDQTLAGRIALVTGASRGIGAAAAQELARRGAHVILTARTVGGLEEADDAIKAAGGTATLAPLDLLKFDQIDVLGASIFDRFKKLDILIGAAGMLGALSPIAHAEPKDWRRVFDLNVHANQRLLRSFDPLLKQSDAGRAVFITSGVASGVRPFMAAYGASKAALDAMVKMYAAETATTAVRANLYSPGPVATRLRETAYPGEDPSRLPTPADVAPELVDLATPACALHGQNIRYSAA